MTGMLLSSAALMIAISSSEPVMSVPAGTISSQARIQSRVFAKCVIDEAGYRLQPSLNAQVRKNIPGETSTRFMPAISGECFEKIRTFKVSQVLLRGEIYDTLFTKKFVGKSATDFAKLDSISYPVADVDDVIAITYRNGIKAADCVARRHTLAALALLTSPIETYEEVQAFGPVQRSFRDCGLAADQPATQPALQRVLIAEAMYRLNVAATSASKSDRSGGQ